MNTEQAIETLRKEIKVNPVANDVMHMFASRKRARHMVTLSGLATRMKEEGFEHNEAEYAKVLKLMASLGFGEVSTDYKGKVQALKGLKITLQSLGAAVHNQEQKLSTFNRRNRYTQLVADVIKKEPQTVRVFPYRISGDVSITLSINGKPIIVPLSGDLTPEEIGALVRKFREMADKPGEPPKAK